MKRGEVRGRQGRERTLVGGRGGLIITTTVVLSYCVDLRAATILLSMAAIPSLVFIQALERSAVWAMAFAEYEETTGLFFSKVLEDAA